MDKRDMREKKPFKQNSRRQFRIRGTAALLSVMLVLPAIPMSVHAEEKLYEVQPGDCLWKIAEKYLGDGAGYADIVAWNEELIQNPNLIYPGMTLRIDLGPYRKGTISGTTWESAWLGMHLELPERLKFIDVEEFFEDFGENTYIALPKDSERRIDWEMVAIDTKGILWDAYAFVVVEQSDYSVDEYMEQIRTEIEKEVTDGSGVDMSWVENGEAEMAGKPFKSYHVEVEYENTSLSQNYFIRQLDDRIVLYCDSVESFSFPEMPVW